MERYLYIKHKSEILYFDTNETKISKSLKDKMPVFEIDGTTYFQKDEIKKSDIMSYVKIGTKVSVPFTDDRLVESVITDIKPKYRVIAVKGVGLVEYEDVQAIYIDNKKIPLY